MAFFALTSTDVVDELVFQECILIGAIQLTFGFDLNTVLWVIVENHFAFFECRALNIPKP